MFVVCAYPICFHNLAIFIHCDLGGKPLIPELRDFHRAWHLLLTDWLEPRLLQRCAHILLQELCECAGLRELTKVVDCTPALSNQIEVAGKLFCVLHQRMVQSGELLVLQNIRPLHLLARLNTHLQHWDENVSIRHLDVRLLDDKPLACVPLVSHAIVLIVIEATLHAHDWLVILTHGELLQVNVSLEHDLSNAGSLEPIWLETFHLPLAVRSVQPILRILARVQREQRLAAFRSAHLQCQAEVFQIHGSCGVHSWRDLHRVALL
mmetsp:Transcript_41899/g.72607  ORF Transcript_41899/g.72607 Transcript_41899/m.72607 type:complete len:265 (+) Transcript_41899:314-1108(+)